MLKSAQGHCDSLSSILLLPFSPTYHQLGFHPQTTLPQLLSSRLPMISILLKSTVRVSRLILLNGSAASDSGSLTPGNTFFTWYPGRYPLLFCLPAYWLYCPNLLADSSTLPIFCLLNVEAFHIQILCFPFKWIPSQTTSYHFRPVPLVWTIILSHLIIATASQLVFPLLHFSLPTAWQTEGAFENMSGHVTLAQNPPMAFLFTQGESRSPYSVIQDSIWSHHLPANQFNSLAFSLPFQHTSLFTASPKQQPFPVSRPLRWPQPLPGRQFSKISA